MKKLIVIVILLSALSLFADVINWSEFSFRSFITTNKDDMPLSIGDSAIADDMIDNAPKYGINWKHQLKMTLNKSWNISIDNNLFYSNKSQENLNAYFFNYSKLRLFYVGKSQSVKLQFSNRLFQQDKTRWLTISGTEQTTRQNMVNMVEIHYKKYLNSFDFSIYTQLRNLKYVYIENSAKNSESENDFATHIQFDYHLNKKITLFTTGYYKDDLNKENWYNHTQVGVGAEYLNRYDFFNILRSKLTYLNNSSDRIDDEKTHYFIYNLRYTKRIGNNFAAFTFYESRFCFDMASTKFLRISNQLRMQAKYSYQSDKMHHSFVLGGFKINPENSANSVFAEVNQNVWHSFYASAFTRFAFKRYVNIAEKLEYFFSTEKSIWLKHDFTHFRKESSEHLIFIGTTLLF